MKFALIFLLLTTTSKVIGQKYETNSDGSTNFPSNSYDLKNYSKVRIVKTLKDCFGKSYVYYFSVGENKFRVVHIRSDEFPQTATIQKLVSNKWQNRIEFQNGNKLDDFFFKDVNNDGFIDIVRHLYFDDEIYLYKPSVNNFIDSVCGILNYDVFLIDSLRSVYCDFQEYRQGAGSIFSTLYTFNDYSIYYLYKLELYNDDDDGAGGHSKITKLILSKCVNGNRNLENLKKLKTIKLKHPLDADKEKYFNDKEFWKKEYKSLLL